MHIKRFITAGAVTLAGAGAIGSAAQAAPVTQQGLVNLNVTDVAVQVPIGVAANICDVNVAVLVNDLIDQAADCNADADQTATVTSGDSGPVTQNGLVNVNLTDVSVQVPIGIAANVCDVNVGVLVSNLVDQADGCDAESISVTRIS